MLHASMHAVKDAVQLISYMSKSDLVWVFKVCWFKIVTIVYTYIAISFKDYSNKRCSLLL